MSDCVSTRDDAADEHAQRIAHRISYFLAGLFVYGGLGWLADQLLDTIWFLPGGLLIGTAAAVYLNVKRCRGRHE